jgi:hypothetical protein
MAAGSDISLFTVACHGGHVFIAPTALKVSYYFRKFKVIRRMNMSNGILMILCSFVEITWVVETCRTPGRFFFTEQKTQPGKQFVILQPHNHATFS